MHCVVVKIAFGSALVPFGKPSFVSLVWYLLNAAENLATPADIDLSYLKTVAVALLVWIYSTMY